MKKYDYLPIGRCFLVLLTCFIMQPAVSRAVDNVCPGGGIPPFLSSGAKPNLLLALDNSGSMLDMAYVQTVGECVDNGFGIDPATNLPYTTEKTYAGLFDPKKWYKWTEGTRQWQNGETYSVGEFVYSGGVFYKAETVTGASTGAGIDSDTNATWTRVHEIATWTNGNVYPAKSFVQFNNQLYYTVAGGTATDADATDGISIEDDTTLNWVAVDSTWLDNQAYNIGDVVSDNGMLFNATTAGTSDGTGVFDDSAVTWSRLDEGHFAETTYLTSGDAAAALSGASGTAYSQDNLYIKITKVGDTLSGVTAFAATGNLLNWASASKFDIQKKILTGGKYDENQQSLISQGRGCSSRGFIKEVAVNSGAAVITFSVQGQQDENWIDTTDDTTRIAVLGVSDGGFIGSDRYEACQNVIEEISSENPSLGTIQTQAKICLDYTDQNNVAAASNAAYNHSVQTCWFINKHPEQYPNGASDIGQGDISSITGACENIYDNGIPPSTISYTDSGYQCYGVYNQAVPDEDRSGYVGRCWEPGSVPVGCIAKTCSSGYGPGNDPRCFPDNYQYECSSTLDKDGECKKEWVLVIEDDPAILLPVCPANAVASAGKWTDDGTATENAMCIKQAIWDYCGNLKIPEVIDPSDQLFNTGETWGMIGALTDSGIAAFFNTERPLLVMKGYIKPPVDADGQTVVPEGILHEVADDLRIGAMAFNSNGSKTECQSAVVNDTIEQFCPDVDRDGARIIAPIKNGDAPTADGKQHVDDLAAAINDIRATSWTPLAEAIYNALGYYGQNSAFRLDPLDFTLASEDPTFADPVQNWCQGNYILVITEGASTADINPDVVTNIKVTNAGLTDTTVAPADEGECLNTKGLSDLYGSTFLDDLTYYGQNPQDAGIFTNPTMLSDDGTTEDKQDIKTYLVVTGVPRDDGSDGECNPATIMTNAATNGGTTLLTGEDPSELETNLLSALSDILSRASAGSAASVIASSRSGEGGVYQAIFWPKVDRGIGKEPLLWAGDVHAFFIDEHGLLWDDYSKNAPAGKGAGVLWTEDTNGNGILDTSPQNEDINENGKLDGDRRIITFYNGSTESTQICFNPTVIDTGLCARSDYFGMETLPSAVELRDFENFLWSANQQLSNITQISTNRATLADGSWDFTNNRRFIFTWNDLDNDGRIDSDYDEDGSIDDDEDGVSDREEILELVPGMNSPDLSVAPAASPRNGFLSDFNVADNTEFDDLIDWLRGNDIYETDTNSNGTLEPIEDKNGNGVRDYALRCRKFPECDPNAVNSPPWRLADVIHSTPTLVARPAEGYHFVYNDPDYAKFYKKYLERRHVIYFGSNDGMLHALNAGFYLAGLQKFLPCREDQRDQATNECIVSSPYSNNSADAYPALGDELWAYVPYNLQPHLSCLTNPEYDHKYFVDAPPRIFDVRIFPDDDMHPGGWGTILVGYMRFGGVPVVADESVPLTDNRKFVSSYFILDITDPERPPTLIAEMTTNTDTQDYDGDGTAEEKYSSMGFTTAMPTVVAMRNDEGKSEWYLVFGNGPDTIKGENTTLQGKVAVIPLNSLTGVNSVSGDGTYDPTARKPFRIPNTEPSLSLAHFGRKLIEADSGGVVNGFVGDLVSVDFDIQAPAVAGVGVPYKTDAVYFGTVDGSGFGTDADGKSYWDGDGRLFRLETNDLDADGNQTYTYPESWELKKLLDAHGPITSAPNIGYDDSNFWIYFGTGRFYAPEDKTDNSTQYFFGVKEPLDGDCNFTWDEVEWWSGTPGAPITTNPAQSPGNQGLLRTDPARVIESGTSGLFNIVGNYLYCEDDAGVACTFPLTPLNPDQGDALHTYYAFSDLEKYIKGEACGGTNDGSIGIDGWYRQFNGPRERSLGMPTLLGGLVTYTSYQPFADLCKAEGLSYLYGVYYLTGTAWYESVFGTYNNPEQKSIVKDKLDLGKGQATTPSLQVGGGPNDVNAYIQTSTGEIIQVGQENLPLSNTKSGRTSWRSR